MTMLFLERRTTSLISWITIASGALQLVAPQRLLPLIGVAATPQSAQLFATVGMFMILFGGAVLHAQSKCNALPVVLLWAGFQKLGAAGLVAWAVLHGVFAPQALLVAGFDLASSLLFLDLRRRGG